MAGGDTLILHGSCTGGTGNYQEILVGQSDGTLNVPGNVNTEQPGTRIIPNGSAGTPTTFLAASGDTPCIQGIAGLEYPGGGGMATFFTASHYVTFDGINWDGLPSQNSDTARGVVFGDGTHFVVKNGFVKYGGFNSGHTESSNILIQNMDVGPVSPWCQWPGTNPETGGEPCPHGLYLCGADHIIEDNFFHEPGHTCIQVSCEQGGISNVTIRRNRLEQCRAVGISASGSDLKIYSNKVTGFGLAGIRPGGPGTQVVNNTINQYDVTLPGGGDVFGILNGGATGDIKNNIILNMRVATNNFYALQNINFAPMDTAKIHHNLCDAAGNVGCTLIETVDNTIVTNQAAKIYTLVSGSPAIGAGQFSSIAPTDFLGAAFTNPPDIGAYKFTGGGGDVTPPTVSITAPAQAATVSGAITVSANASDNIAVVGVQFKLDGATLGGEDTSSPYAITWDTTSTTDASHTLTAVARDAAGNTATSAGITVTVLNGSPPTGTFYVATTGDDSRSCATAQNSATPKQTLTSGVGCLGVAGNILLLRAGTYVDSLDTGLTPIVGGASWAAPTTIAAYPGETVTLQAASGKPVVLFLRNGPTDKFLLFDRLIVDGASVALSNGLAAMAQVHDIRFQNGEIKNTYYEPVFLQDASNIEILSSHIHGSTLLSLITVAGTTSAILIQGNTFDTAPLPGIRADSVGTTGLVVLGNILTGLGLGSSVGAITVAGPFALIANNIIQGGYQGIVVKATATSALLANNTIVSNTQAGVVVTSGASSTALTNNILYNNSSPLTNNGTGTTQTTNLTTDPLFVNAPAQNFRLQAGSAARDTGTSVAAFTTSFYGVPRPSGTAWDIGAAEYDVTTEGTEPTGLATSANTAITFLNEPTGLATSASTSITFLGEPTGLGVTP